MWDFSLGAINASIMGFKTTKKFIPDLPKIKETTISIPDVDGIIQIDKKFEERIIKVKGFIEGSSYADMVTKIYAFSGFLWSAEDRQLIFNDQTDKFYFAQKLKNEEINRGGTFSDRLLEFKCNDPFAYAVTPDSVDENGITVKGTTWNITNNGYYYAWPIITITFNQVQTHIYIANNNISGNRFDISKSFLTNDVLVINSKTMAITLNGTYSPAGFGDGGTGKADYILLNTGDNELEVSTDDGTIDVDINVNFSKVYL